MTILLLGATGRTGRHLLQQALDRGHTVHALVRDPAAIKLNHSNLRLFEGSPLDREKLSVAMEGTEAIVSALNVSRTSDWPWAPLRSPADLLSKCAGYLQELATARGIQRLVVMSAWGVAETRKDIPFWFRWAIEHSNLKFPYSDHERQEQVLLQGSLNFTAVRAAGLTNGKGSQEVIISIGNQPRPRLLISRATVAGFMLDLLPADRYPRQCIVVSAK